MYCECMITFVSFSEILMRLFARFLQCVALSSNVVMPVLDVPRTRSRRCFNAPNDATVFMPSIVFIMGESLSSNDLSTDSIPRTIPSGKFFAISCRSTTRSAKFLACSASRR